MKFFLVACFKVRGAITLLRSLFGRDAVSCFRETVIDRKVCGT